MLSLWVDKNPIYDGHQLQPLHNYLNHGLLGDSIVSWVGACDVNFDHMLDGEDLRVLSPIQADKMLHFVLEIFDQSLHAGVFLQRLMGEIMRETLRELGDSQQIDSLRRQGDDLYLKDGKLNVSIATCCNRSFLIHFGVNVSNGGTPVKTAALCDFGITDIPSFAKRYMEKVTSEVESQIRATQKVKIF